MQSIQMFDQIGYELEESDNNIIVFAKYTEISETKIIINVNCGAIKKKKRYKWDTYLSLYQFTAPEIVACAALIQERNIRYVNN